MIANARCQDKYAAAVCLGPSWPVRSRQTSTRKPHAFGSIEQLYPGLRFICRLVGPDDCPAVLADTATSILLHLLRKIALLPVYFPNSRRMLEREGTTGQVVKQLSCSTLDPNERKLFVRPRGSRATPIASGLETDDAEAAKYDLVLDRTHRSILSSKAQRVVSSGRIIEQG